MKEALRLSVGTTASVCNNGGGRNGPRVRAVQRAGPAVRPDPDSQCPPPSSDFTAWIIDTMTFWASPYTMLVLSLKNSSFSTPE